jgi:hypothetical protein
VAQRFIALNLSPDAPNSQISLLNSLIAGKSRGDWRDQHCVASQAVRCSEIVPLIFAERPANGGLLRINPQSPGSDFGHSPSEMADSLRRTFEKFPFLGDRGRRQGSICTAWRACSATRRILRLGRRQVGNAEPALPRRDYSAKAQNPWDIRQQFGNLRADAFAGSIALSPGAGVTERSVQTAKTFAKTCSITGTATCK